MCRYSTSADYFTKAIDLGDDVPLNYYKRGVAYYHIDDLNKALINWGIAAKGGDKDAIDLIRDNYLGKE